MKAGTRRWALLVVISFAASVGCTRDGRQAPTPQGSAAQPAAPVERPALPKPEPEWRVEKVDYDPKEAPPLSCEIEPCAAGIGFLSANEHVCTAFLVADDVVITAAHCVSPGHMHIWFPGGERRTVVGTLQISSSGESLMPDFARLKLDRPARTRPLRVSRAGFPHATFVKVPHWRKTAGDLLVLSEGQCQIRQKTALFPLFKSDFDRVTAITDCDFNVQSGVSGAPVQNQAGEVIGVLGSYIETQDLPISAVMSAKSISLSPKVAIVTNLACEAPAHPSCRFNFGEKELNMEMRDLARAAMASSPVRSNEALTKQIDLWKADHSKVFRWKTIPQPDFNSAEEIFTEAPLIALPECFKPSKDWIADFQKSLVSLKESARVRGRLQRWGNGVELQDYLFQPAPVAVAFGDFVLQFNPAHLLANGSTKVQMASIEERTHAKVAVSRNLNLSFCAGR